MAKTDSRFALIRNIKQKTVHPHEHRQFVGFFYTKLVRTSISPRSKFDTNLLMCYFYFCKHINNPPSDQMKKIQFVLETSLLNFVLPTLLKIGTEPVVQVSRSPEGFLGENTLVSFETPSESTHQAIDDFLKRLQKATPNSVHLLH